jgi:hypothetical protein
MDTATASIAGENEYAVLTLSAKPCFSLIIGTGAGDHDFSKSEKYTF